MRNKLLLAVILFVSAGLTHANTVNLFTAQTAAGNFYVHNFNTSTPTLSLVYTAMATDGTPLYYVFNVNGNNGFVIVSAEDATQPVLAYSSKGQFVLPSDNNNVAWWLGCRGKEIEAARAKGLKATTDIKTQWSNCINNTFPDNKTNRIASVSPLLGSTWNQAPYYNAWCPGGSVTGCVATAMAQIMRFWQYPSHGHGYSAYWDESQYGFQRNYGHLYADYDTSHYNWASMPLNLSSNNDEVAELMYDCGVSVCMDYSPSGSGAWVINGDYPVSSQNSYVKYFGYNPKTIQGVYKNNYTNPAWVSLIENELNNGRPVQYVGNDSVNNAGHTWVCDGYDASNNFHMNWGWGGADNGYYSPTALSVAGYNFNWWDEAVIGIEPEPVSTYFEGNPLFGKTGLTVNFADSSITTSPVTSYKWLFPGGSPSTSTSANPTVVYNTPGAYDVTEIVSDSSGSDTLVKKAYIAVESSTTLPVKEGFEASTALPSGWNNYNPFNYSYTWQVDTNVGSYGTSKHCMYFDNAQAWDYFFTIIVGLWTPPPGKAALDIISQRERIYTPMYKFSAVAAPVISFDVAYAPYNNTFSDTLAIYYSTDSGATFNQVYLKGGMTLCTTGNAVVTGADTNSKGVFVPTNSEWRTDTIQIPAIAGAPSVMFAFENRSGNGSPIYIDNINIPGAPTAISSVSAASSVSIYPNPGNGEFTIKSSVASGQSSVIKVFNILGKQIYSGTVQNGISSLNLSNESKGMYLYRVYSQTGSILSTGKLVIE